MKRSNIGSADLKLLKELYKDNFDEIEKKLNENYPIQYLIGNVEFLNTFIKVDERVLIPRFETELLVDKALKKLKNFNIKNPKILELGTGSGCIAIALKKNIVCEVDAVDISKESLSLAQENALQNNVSIKFIEADMLKVDYKDYDIIISNPPYVSREETVGEETKYEPQIALYAENNGLYFYQEIIKKIALYPNIKFVAFEIGITQGKKIEELTKTYLKNYQCTIEKDFTNRDRFAFIEKCE